MEAEAKANKEVQMTLKMMIQMGSQQLQYRLNWIQTKKRGINKALTQLQKGEDYIDTMVIRLKRKKDGSFFG